MNPPSHRTVLLALVTAALLSAALPAGAQVQPHETHLIQISLLVASKSGPSELADLPANTRKAIEDVRQFLPFRSYRLLDTALVRTDRGARTKLTGPDGREYRASISLDPRAEAGKLLVQSFALIEAETAPAAYAEADEAGGAALAPPPPSGPALSSSFAAEIGQPVVVGTSRLNGGDEALMVLFTALP